MCGEWTSMGRHWDCASVVVGESSTQRKSKNMSRNTASNYSEPKVTLWNCPKDDSQAVGSHTSWKSEGQWSHWQSSNHDMQISYMQYANKYSIVVNTLLKLIVWTNSNILTGQSWIINCMCSLDCDVSVQVSKTKKSDSILRSSCFFAEVRGQFVQPFDSWAQYYFCWKEWALFDPLSLCTFSKTSIDADFIKYFLFQQNQISHIMISHIYKKKKKSTPQTFAWELAQNLLFLLHKKTFSSFNSPITFQQFQLILLQSHDSQARIAIANQRPHYEKITEWLCHSPVHTLWVDWK